MFVGFLIFTFQCQETLCVYWCVGVYPSFNFSVNCSALEKCEILHLTKISRYTVFFSCYPMFCRHQTSAKFASVHGFANIRLQRLTRVPYDITILNFICKAPLFLIWCELTVFRSLLHPKMENGHKQHGDTPCTLTLLTLTLHWVTVHVLVDRCTCVIVTNAIQ